MFLSWEQGSFQGDGQDCNHGWALNRGCPTVRYVGECRM